jgi:glycosyltransferase involved in cell wall biosynthesis
MKIAIDLRSLQSGSVSGVENYTQNLLERLLALDKQNQYILFYNSWRGSQAGDLNFINSGARSSKIPNKILNLLLKTGWVNLEKFAGEFDLLFMPNLNQFNISSSAKLAITVHDLSPVVTPEFYNAKRKLWHWFLNYKKSFERADILFAVSEWTKQDLIDLFRLPSGKIKVVYPGVSPAEFNQKFEPAALREVRNLYSLPGRFLLFLNTLEPRKNLINLVSAFERLDWPGHLIIAGKKGWKYKEIFRRIKNSSKSDRIKYIGYIHQRHKAGLIKLSDALVYPSFYEGFGFQPLEAAACGTPVITSHAAALPEVSGSFAMLANPYDVGSITKGLDELLTNEQLRQNLIANGLAKLNEYTWEKSAGQILTAINSL